MKNYFTSTNSDGGGGHHLNANNLMGSNVSLQSGGHLGHKPLISASLSDNHAHLKKNGSKVKNQATFDRSDIAL